MKKRLRKKLHKAEFQEFGFNLAFDYNQSLSSDEVDKLVFYNFLDEAIEKNGLIVGGGYSKESNKADFFVAKISGTVTLEDIDCVREWLEKQSNISNVIVSGSIDAWYGWD